MLGNFFDKIPSGVMKAFGADPIAMKNGVTTWRFGRSAFDQVDGTMKFSPNADMAKEAANQVGWGGSAMGVGSMAFSMGAGLYTGGLGGMVGMMVEDIAIDRAIIKHAYSPGRDAAGKALMNKPGLLKNAGLYSAGMFGGAVGSGIGAAATSLTGLPGLETLGYFAGASAGVKHAGKLGAGGMILAGAAAAGGVAYAGAKFGHGVLKMGYDHKQRQKMIQTSGSMVSFNTQAAHTMRARAVQAIHKNHLNTRSALGQEASYLHYPSRSYNSRYR